MRLATAAAAALVVSGCIARGMARECDWARVATVTISPPSLTLARGDTARLHVSFIPPRSGSGCPPHPFTFVWTSADTTIADIDGDGMVSARRPGSTTITVITSDGPAGTAGVVVRP